ncbi:ATP-dependent protease [Lujinxingia litoralis]|uniref:endopeptidase La n=1 Tax=Lujinxingia litoralis TaxID=2211119 RepID=A0A328C708_9DELT|nr:ATP-binding protein [Lujinxingia litoralis]RAL20314.1 ATP-dependent protease [Lujinxingia litoralis]
MRRRRRTRSEESDPSQRPRRARAESGSEPSELDQRVRAIEAATQLETERLRRVCAPADLGLSSSQELERGGVPGQERAREALGFGLSMQRPGYHIFAIGPPGLGKHEQILQTLNEEATRRPAPHAWCYVYNFENPRAPRALQLARGRATELREAMEEFVEALRDALPRALESPEYARTRRDLDEGFERRQKAALDEVRAKAQEHQVAVIQTPSGVVMAPVVDDEVLGPMAFQELEAGERTRFEEALETLHTELEDSLRELAALESEHRRQVEALEEATVRAEVDARLKPLCEAFADCPQVLDYLQAVEDDIVEHAEAFVGQSGADQGGLLPGLQAGQATAEIARRYEVNVLHEDLKVQGAPVVQEHHPNFENLFGRIDHRAQLGAISTDFTMIRPGALHRANGGFLVLDVRQVLMQPMVWEQLKRALRAGELRIESPAQVMGLFSTQSLEPEPVALDVKVILVGERRLYYLLEAYDPDVSDLFKVMADFEATVERDAQVEGFLKMVAWRAEQLEVGMLSVGALARLVEWGARQAEDARRLSVAVERVDEVLAESDWQRTQRQGDEVQVEDVEAALQARRRRASRLRERMEDAMERGVLHVDLEGEQIAQVNALSVVELAGERFGRPSRITASVQVGAGQLLDIEREVELSGALHAKGVLILGGYLGHEFGQQRPLALSARLVFEQSYGGVDGDSASLAETLALLSAISTLPLKQGLAITGSIDQRGRVQAIGGVNAKIEGFFDVCQRHGLSGEQGVVVPASNAQHLMLSDRVVEAVRDGKFFIYAVETVRQAVALMFGLPAGRRTDDDAFEEDSVFGQVDRRLEALARAARHFDSRGAALGSTHSPQAPAPEEPPSPDPPTAEDAEEEQSEAPARGSRTRKSRRRG